MRCNRNGSVSARRCGALTIRLDLAAVGIAARIRLRCRGCGSGRGSPRRSRRPSLALCQRRCCVALRGRRSQLRPHSFQRCRSGGDSVGCCCGARCGDLGSSVTKLGLVLCCPRCFSGSECAQLRRVVSAQRIHLRVRCSHLRRSILPRLQVQTKHVSIGRWRHNS